MADRNHVNGRFSRELLELPTQGVAAACLLRLIDAPGDDAADIAELATIVESDVALSAQILRLANGPAHGTAGRVSNVRQAMTVLTVPTVRAVALAATMRMVDGRPKAGPAGYWHHAVTTAASTAAVARLVGYNEAEAFSVGLLHDLGGFLLHVQDANRFQQSQGMTTPQSIDEVLTTERALFGIDHAGAGAEALHAWGLPAHVVESVALHHVAVEITAVSVHALALILRAGEALALAGSRPVSGHCPIDPARALGALSLGESAVRTVAKIAEELLSGISIALEAAA
ncbi:MAG: HDOD domain-containing protein [Acidimicrobiia bacterium]